jgi:hypothetical protein
MREENISDSEIRIVGSSQKPTQKPFPWGWVVVGVVLVVCLGVILWWQYSKTNAEQESIGVFEQEQPVVQTYPLTEWFASVDSITAVGTVTTDITINDIPLRVYLPLNSVPHLEVGYGVTKKCQNSILFFQAADVRADNGKIVGAFVLQGKPLSWGLSKRGFCAILDRGVSIGVTDNSPLFEKATEEGGDFFRQYPLVDNGKFVANEPKNKSVRRAICERKGEIFMIESLTKESFHDFTQALVDLGVDNAVNLAGSEAYGWAIDREGVKHEFGTPNYYTGRGKMPKNTNYIVWRLKTANEEYTAE